ncbi:MAG TPA: matrixin family metalloprotease [Bdellovibrionota bacterium]|nr:matrixin family metalloprotease [Bdellovibrionota bacterium]
MKKLIALSSLALVATAAFAHVRQRSFYQYDEDNVDKGGVEAIIRWTSSLTLKMHQFTGCLSAGSGISFDGTSGGCTGDAHTMMGESVAQWFGTSAMGIAPDLDLVLDGDDNPVATTSACETTTDREADGVNNIVFTSKINTACANSIEVYDGVIGLTRVRYALTTGQIVEADIQFNDNDYRYVSTANDLDNTPPRVNLKDVAVHELGHLFGLDHSSSRTSTMLFAVSDGMNSASSDDVSGMWSLYQNASSGVGSLKGSLTLNGAPVFGVPIYVLNARTLQMVSSEMSNLDGAFEFCGLPEGDYIAYASSYRPASSNIHEYYSGFDGYAPQDGGLCANPGCQRMNTSIKPSWFVSSTAPDFGKNMNVFSVSGGTANRYLNLKASTSAVSIAPIGTGESDLELDVPRLMTFRSADIGAAASGALSGRNDYLVTAPASGELTVKIASLSLYTRLVLTATLLDPITGIAPVGPTCNDTAAVTTEGADGELECTGLTPSTEYKIRVTASAITCGAVPGNEGGCLTSAGEVASTPTPYYLINVYDPTSSDTGLATTSLSTSSLASSSYSDLPSCSNGTTEIAKKDEPACCGSIGGHGIDAGKSLWLGLVMSPLTWVLLAIAIARLRRRVQTA